MARIPEQVIEQVRDATDIVDFISQYVQLQKQGKKISLVCVHFMRNGRLLFRSLRRNKFFTALAAVAAEMSSSF